MEIQFSKTRAALQNGIDRREHRGAQLCILRDGNVAADCALGDSEPGVAMTTGTLNLWMSAVKPIVAAAILQLCERGQIELHDPVIRYIPQFGQRGKDTITIWQLLTHTGGFRIALGLRWADDYDTALAKIYAAPLEPRWQPGVTAGYHATTSWPVLGEIVRRVDGRALDVFLREELFLPCDMPDCWLGMPVDVAKNYGTRLGGMAETHHDPFTPLSYANGVENATAVRASGNGRGPMNQLVRFYEMLRRGGVSTSGVTVLSAATVDQIIFRQRAGRLDLTFKHVIDWGLGVMINSQRHGSSPPYGFGTRAGDATFGHSGNQSSCAFCDPQNQLVVAWCCNGMPGESRHAARQRAINDAVYEDLFDSGLLPPQAVDVRDD